MSQFLPSAAFLLVSFLGSVADLTGDVFRFFRLMVHSHSALGAEILFLRKRLAFYEERQVKPRRLSDVARLSLVVLSRMFEWKDALVIVKPETPLGWHRKGFKLFLNWKSRVEGSAGTARTAADCPRDSRPDPQDVSGESHVGYTAHSRRVGSSSASTRFVPATKNSGQPDTVLEITQSHISASSSDSNPK
jgi:hypothetical protein